MDELTEDDIKDYLIKISHENSVSALEKIQENPSFDGTNAPEILAQEVINKEDCIKILLELSNLLLEKNKDSQSKKEEIKH